MLDNMTTEEMQEAIAVIDGRAGQSVVRMY